MHVICLTRSSDWKHSVDTEIEELTFSLPLMTDKNPRHCDVSHRQSGNNFPYLYTLYVNSAVSDGRNISVV